MAGMETERWDILDAAGRPTGRTHERGRPLAPGEYHLVVHIWILDDSGCALVQKRADDLDWMPGAWAATGGSALAGEGSLEAAIRETAEELGLAIPPHRWRRFGRVLRNANLSDLWVTTGRRAEFEPMTLHRDVAAVRWVAWPELSAMVVRGAFVDYGDEYRALVAPLFGAA